MSGFNGNIKKISEFSNTLNNLQKIILSDSEHFDVDKYSMLLWITLVYILEWM